MANNTSDDELDNYDIALDFLVDVLDRGEIETGLAKNSQGKGGYSIDNEATKRLAALIKQEAERHADKLIGKNTYAVRPSGGSNAWKAQDELRNEMRSKNIYPLKEVI